MLLYFNGSTEALGSLAFHIRLAKLHQNICATGIQITAHHPYKRCFCRWSSQCFCFMRMLYMTLPHLKTPCLDWRTNIGLSSKFVCFSPVVLCSLNTLFDLLQLLCILSLDHQFLAVSHGIMHTHRHELLPNDVRQPGGFKQSHDLAGWVGNHWLDVIRLQISDPLL